MFVLLLTKNKIMKKSRIEKCPIPGINVIGINVPKKELQVEIQDLGEQAKSISAKVDARAINDDKLSSLPLAEKEPKCTKCGGEFEGAEGGDTCETCNDDSYTYDKPSVEELKYQDRAPNYKELHASELPIYRKWICGDIFHYYRGRIVNGRVVCDKIGIDVNECSYITLHLNSVMAHDNIESNETEFNNAICKLITYLEK